MYATCNHQSKCFTQGKNPKNTMNRLSLEQMKDYSTARAIPNVEMIKSGDDDKIPSPTTLADSTHVPKSPRSII